MSGNNQGDPPVDEKSTEETPTTESGNNQGDPPVVEK